MVIANAKSFSPALFGKQVADFLNRDPSVIVRMVEKVESKIQEDNNFRQSVATLARYLAKRG